MRIFYFKFLFLFGWSCSTNHFSLENSHLKEQTHIECNSHTHNQFFELSDGELLLYVYLDSENELEETQS